MATIICEKCGTRNADTMLSCRRCKESLIRAAEASVSVLGGIWGIGPPLAENPLLFSGTHLATSEPVLIKRLSRAAAMDRTIRSRFLHEASILKSLQHPHLIQVLDVIEDPASPAIVLARPEGLSLSTLLNLRGRLPIPVAINFGLQLLTTLDYLHSQGVVHRDLTAAKAFITRHRETGLPHIMITDFGLARSVHLARASEAETGTLMGMAISADAQIIPSPYMAPELLNDESDSRSDIYSLGVLLFELISGRLPVGHVAQTAEQMIHAIQHEAPTILRLLRPEVSADLEETLLRMMDKNPDHRYMDISEARTALLAVSDSTMVRVPAGGFLRGSGPEDRSARPEEKPQRVIQVNAFFVDRLPVTVRQFRIYLNATGQQMPDSWHKNNPESFPDYPVVSVTWDEAKAYAEWIGGRLPTEAEWEKAARGTDGRLFPWGNTPPTTEHAQFSAQERGSVLQHPAGASVYGCLDMAGNAFEWVLDWYNSNYYAVSPEEDPRGPESGEKRVLKGGSFVHSDSALRCASRGRYAPHERRANHGFRCVWALDH